MLADVFYGKHILTGPGRDANRWRMICVRRQWRRAGRQKNIPSRVRLNDVAETGPGFGKTFVNDRVIDHQDGTHGDLPWRRFDVSAVPLVIETAFDSIAQRLLPYEP